MKVLFTGVYRDLTGYGQASTDYILALDKAGVDVVIRPIKLNSHKSKLPERLLELEGKSAGGTDIVMQHILPHLMEYDGRFKKNIALYCSETSNFKSSNWASYLNSMDIAWVPSQHMVQAAKNSGVDIPISIVPYATDIERFQRSYEPLSSFEPIKDDFKFYTIGEMTRRKNFVSLIRAFHTEFDTNEPVQLVIKTSIPGKNATEAKNTVLEFCSKVKEGLKLYPQEGYYKKEIIITDCVSNDSIMRIHNACDCFVLPSYGESWCLPAFDAMSLGKTPIVTKHSGFLEYIDNSNGWLINCIEDDVFGMTENFGDLYTATEQWGVPSVSHLRKCMREAYENKDKRQKKALNGMDKAYHFSYENIGRRMKEMLEEYV